MELTTVLEGAVQLGSVFLVFGAMFSVGVLVIIGAVFWKLFKEFKDF